MTDGIAVHTEYSKPARSLSTHIVSLTGYLLGVNAEIFGREFRMATFEELEKRPEAKIIRCLCTIRNSFLKNFGRISIELRNNLTDLDRLTDYFDPELFSYLYSQGIQFLRPNTKPMKYLLNVNMLINERIGKVQPLYPMWVDWSFIRKLFQMPKGGNEKDVSRAIDTYRDNYNNYPYHCYLNWPVYDVRAYIEEPEMELNPVPGGNILLNDRKFLILLYRVNGAEFSEWKYVTDISADVQDDLGAFLEDCRRIILVVDCENSDPYKLCAVLKGLREAALRNEIAINIGKIILYDDVHTVDAWGILKDYVKAPVEHVVTERVNEHKSLVDVQMAVGIAREHYQNAVDGFLLASSDSDFWGVVKSMPGAKFMVLLEREKFGTYLTETLDLSGVGYCIMDDFAGHVDDIKAEALNRALLEYIDERIDLNLDEVLEQLYPDLRLFFTEKQRRLYREKVSKGLRVKIAGDGKMKIELAT